MPGRGAVTGLPPAPVRGEGGRLDGWWARLVLRARLLRGPGGAPAAYFFQVSRRVTVRLNTGAPSRESTRSATK